MSNHAERIGMSETPVGDREPETDWVIKSFPESTERLHKRLDELELREATHRFHPRLLPSVDVDLAARTITFTW